MYTTALILVVLKTDSSILLTGKNPNIVLVIPLNGNNCSKIPIGTLSSSTLKVTLGMSPTRNLEEESTLVQAGFEYVRYSKHDVVVIYTNESSIV